MLRASIATTMNSPIFRYLSLKWRYVLVRWSRQLLIQLTVLFVGLLYSCAVLEVDLGEAGDSFGDVYDTYVTCKRVESPKPAEAVYREILPANLVIESYQRPLALSVDGLFLLALAPLALYAYRRPKRRRLQVLHAIWRL
jgi:hypothetical protein